MRLNIHSFTPNVKVKFLVLIINIHNISYPHTTGCFILRGFIKSSECHKYHRSGCDFLPVTLFNNLEDESENLADEISH
jgi:hypothetical protein